MTKAILVNETPIKGKTYNLSAPLKNYDLYCIYVLEYYGSEWSLNPWVGSTLFPTDGEHTAFNTRVSAGVNGSQYLIGRFTTNTTTSAQFYISEVDALQYFQIWAFKFNR